jgi:hypothetical protein
MKHNRPIDKGLDRLIDEVESGLPRLRQRALLLGDGAAANELLRRADEVMQHFGPVLMEAPHLLARAARLRLDIPVPIALSRSHLYYYKRVIKQLHELELGSETGIAAHKRANWKGTGSVGGWAILLYNIVEALRTNCIAPDYTTQAHVLHIRKDHPDISRAASKLPEFGRASVEGWIKTACCPILYVYRPELRPAKRGKRKRKDKKRADPRAKRERDAIIQRIRAMVAEPEKSRNYKSRL